MLKALAIQLARSLPGLSQVMKSREVWKQRALELEKENGLFPPGHFYSALQSESETEKFLAGNRSVPDTIPGIDLRVDAQLDFVDELARLNWKDHFLATRTERFRYGYECESYSYSDAIFLMGVLSRYRPKRIIEVGSGNSSILFLDIIDQWLGSETSLTMIEPYPQYVKDLLRPGDEDRVNLLVSPIQDVPFDLFESLEANDVLFLDTTHVSKLNSDVNREVFEILPRLKPGVIIHFHDMFYPFEYPDNWLRERRNWNELYLIRAFLMENHGYEIVAWNHYLATCHRETLEAKVPLCLKNPGGSMWLRKVK